MKRNFGLGNYLRWLTISLSGLLLIGMNGCWSENPHSGQTECKTFLADEPTDIWRISISIDARPSNAPASDVLFDVPQQLREESLRLLEKVVTTCGLDARFRPIQKDWTLLEDAFVDYRLPESSVFWPRYQIKIFGLETDTPTLEVLQYKKDATNPLETGGSTIPPIEKGGGIMLEGEIAREVYSFLSTACQKDHPELAAWLMERAQ